ncbi:MAG: hypothetical protein LBT96_05350 [Campylobacteraceae bacterium]|jgi:hypothetical protein|nr:hypothetical protein [Campylobacteraceae bacterium]
MKKFFSAVFILFFVSISYVSSSMPCKAVLCRSSSVGKKLTSCVDALAKYYYYRIQGDGEKFLKRCPWYGNNAPGTIIPYIDPPGPPVEPIPEDEPPTSPTPYIGGSGSGIGNDPTGQNGGGNGGSSGGYGRSGSSGSGSYGGGSGGGDGDGSLSDGSDEDGFGGDGDGSGDGNNANSGDGRSVDTDEDGIADTTIGELKLKCSAEALNKIEDRTKTRVRTTAQLPEYCLFLLLEHEEYLPLYTCDEEFYYYEDWENGYISENATLADYKAWKADGGEGRTKISDDGTGISYIIEKPIQKECWVQPEIEDDDTNETKAQEVDANGTNVQELDTNETNAQDDNANETETQEIDTDEVNDIDTNEINTQGVGTSEANTQKEVKIQEVYTDETNVQEVDTKVSNAKEIIQEEDI